MLELDYTAQGRRPTVAQIIAAWRKAGKPAQFSVSYGETFAQFEYHAPRWYAHGNGCRGVERDKVEQRLNALTME